MLEWLANQQPSIDFQCPSLTPYPKDTAATLEGLVECAIADGESVYLVGSSLGGFWATYLVEKYQLPAVLVNPAVNIDVLMSNFIDVELKNHYSQERYRLSSEDLQHLVHYYRPVIQYPEQYWLLVQQGDEVLDYRLAVDKYAGAKQTIEANGNHSFEHFERYFPAIMDFFKQPKFNR
jgi:uncharacterized protein